MIDKLEDLKKRAQDLNYKDEKELDDIIRKTKMYLEKLFPSKLTYPSEVGLISFHPTYYVSGMGDGPYRENWNKGQQKLINLLDTRIEELKIENSKPQNIEPQIQVVERIVEVQDNKRIDELTQENITLRKSKTLWNRINWTVVITVGLSVIGGTFYLGHLIGNARFDTDKLELFENNKILQSKSDSLAKELNSANIKIQNLTRLIPEDLTENTLFPLEVEISFLSPTTIFKGQVLITAEDKYSDIAILNFKGIKGLSSIPNGTYDSLTIEIKQGDRFYFKSENDSIYAVNVIESSIDVDLEIIEQK